MRWSLGFGFAGAFALGAKAFVPGATVASDGAPISWASSVRNAARCHRAGLVVGARRAQRVARRLPVGPGDERGEPLAAVLCVLEALDAVAPVAGVQRRVERGALGVVQEEEVDLVGVLVLDRRPGEATGVDEVGVEVDVAGRRIRVLAVDEVDRHRLRHEAPVEARRVQRLVHRRLLLGRPAGEGVRAAGSLCHTGQRPGGRKHGDSKKKGAPHRLLSISAAGPASHSRLAVPDGVVLCPRGLPVPGEGLARSAPAPSRPVIPPPPGSGTGKGSIPLSRNRTTLPITETR